MRCRVILSSAALGLAVCSTAFAQGQPESVPAAPSAEAPPIPRLPAADLAPAPQPVPERLPVNPFRPEPSPIASPAAPELNIPAPAPKPSNSFWRAEIGSRTSWITNSGFDPFASNGDGVDNFFSNRTLGHFHFGLDRTLVSTGRFTIAGGGIWEYGSRTSQVRGAETELMIHRLGASIEPRFHLHSNLYMFGRLIPQLTYTKATLREASVGEVLEAKKWGFGTDVSLGSSWNFLRTFGVPASMVWLSGELGYGFVTNQKLEMKPDYPSEDPRSQISLNLGELGLRGPFMRVSVGATF